MEFIIILIVIFALFALIGKGSEDKKNQKEIDKRQKILDDQQRNLKK